MGLRIFYGLILLLTIFTGTAFAQESPVSVQTDDNHYDEGDTIVISGKVENASKWCKCRITIIYRR